MMNHAVNLYYKYPILINKAIAFTAADKRNNAIFTYKILQIILGGIPEGNADKKQSLRIPGGDTAVYAAPGRIVMIKYIG